MIVIHKFLLIRIITVMERGSNVGGLNLCLPKYQEITCLGNLDSSLLHHHHRRHHHHHHHHHRHHHHHPHHHHHYLHHLCLCHHHNHHHQDGRAPLMASHFSL